MPDTITGEHSILVTCEDCGSPRGGDYIQEIRGCSICEDCAEDYCTCDDCGETHHSDDLNSVCNSIVCDSCRSQNYDTCEDCGDVYPSDSGLFVRDSYAVCDSCAENYNTCDSCDVTYHCSDMSGGLCSSCQEDSQYWEPRPVRAKEGDYRRFGVELETSACDDYYSLKDDTVFGAEDDGSITGKEFVSPVLSYPSGLDHVSTFCNHARGFHVDNRCGFHTHLEISDLTLAQRKALAIAYLNTYRFWASLVPKTRRDNRFCVPSDYTTDQVHEIESESDWNRFCERNGRGTDYFWANWGAFRKYGTLEIRLHTPTLQYVKIASWVSAHVAFIESVKAGTSFPNHAHLIHYWQDFSKVWTEDLVKFYRMRQSKWKQ